MTPSDSNAFLGREFESRGPSANRLAGLLAPMRAELKDMEYGYRLELAPMRSVDAIEPWAQLVEHEGMLTVLCRAASADARPEGGGDCLAGMARRLGAPVVEAWGEDCVALTEESLRYLVAAAELEGATAVLIDGPMEAGDAAAIMAAVSAGSSPLLAEVRAVAALRFEHERAIVVETRGRREAAAFVSQSFRDYLAALRHRPPSEFAAPEPALVEYLLQRTGRMTVRPIETEVFATSIDVGVSTSSNGEVRPADGSLIYDIPSDTWHGE